MNVPNDSDGPLNVFYIWLANKYFFSLEMKTMRQYSLNCKAGKHPFLAMESMFLCCLASHRVFESTCS